MSQIEYLFGKSKANSFKKSIPTFSNKIIIWNLFLVLSISLTISLLVVISALSLHEKYFPNVDGDTVYIILIPFLYGSLIVTSFYFFFGKKHIKDQFTNVSLKETFKHLLILSIPFYSISLALAVFSLLNDPQSITEVINYFEDESVSDSFKNGYIDGLIYIIIWLLVGFGEEIFFRGVLYRTLRKYTGIFLSILVSTSLFVLPHFPSDILSVVNLALFGVVTAWYYEYKNNLLTISIFHLLHDLIMAGVLTYLAAIIASQFS